MNDGCCDAEARLSDLLCELTGGRLSKPTYPVSVMAQAIEECLNEERDRAETTTEWAVRDHLGTPHPLYDEQEARSVMGRQLGWTVVRREVTPWTEADQ